MEGNKVTGDEMKEGAPVMLATQTLKSRGSGWNPGEDFTEGRGPGLCVPVMRQAAGACDQMVWT